MSTLWIQWSGAREWGRPELAGLTNVNGVCDYPGEEVAGVVSLDHICFLLFLGTVLFSAVRGRRIGISYFEVPVFSKSC